MVLNKVTFYRRTISLSKQELADLQNGKYTSIYVSYVGKPKRGEKHGPVFKTDVTWINDVVYSAKWHERGFYTAVFR